MRIGRVSGIDARRAYASPVEPTLDALVEGGRPAPLVAHLLGRVRLAVGDRPIPDTAWPRRTARSLLLLLLATPGHRLPRDRVLDLLWPEASPKTALNALYVALSGLRSVLEPGRPVGRASAYVEVGAEVVGLWSDPGLWVDADAFEATLAAAGGATATARRDALRRALALYGGDLLADEPYADWPVARRERLRRGWRRAVLDLAELEVEANEPLTTTGPLEALLTADPTDEAAHRALMGALAAAGQWDEALHQYRRCVETLRSELDVEPSEETEALAAALRRAGDARPFAAPALATPTAPFDNLPAPPNPLVGRAREMEELQDLLLDPSVRLVTVTGPGGIGKTRLALEVASQAAADFADGVAFVPLAPIQDPALVVPTIARTLGLEEAADRPIADTLREALRERELLLVLDNVEQVLEAAPEMAELLASAPRLKALVTSREPLHLRAEHEYPTPTLSTPDPDRPCAADAAARYEAVVLFAQRARAVQPAFALTDDNAATVATLCARLDGLPLAIELAAARSRALPPERLLAGLEDRFALLAAGYRDLPLRQRTMRDAIAWSHDLLDPPERTLFRRLAAFVGGCDVEAAAAVCSAAGDLQVEVREGLTSLAQQSLLRRENGEREPRFGMLETIREFGAEQLATSGEEGAIRRTHAMHFLALAEEAESGLTGPAQATSLDRLEREHENLRAALAWAIGAQEATGEIALRLIAALWRFWWIRGYLGEGRAWVERALARHEAAPVAVRAKALAAAAEVAEAQGDHDQATAWFEAALSLGQAIGDQAGVAQCLNGLGNVARVRVAFDDAAGLHERALARWREVGDRRGRRRR